MVLAIHGKRLPPNVQRGSADAECPLQRVHEGCEAPRLQAALSRSFAFGGTNATLLFTRA